MAHELGVAPHEASHATGAGDALLSTDVIEAIVKRLRETGGPTTLAMGAVADGDFLKRSGASIVGGSAAAAGLSSVLAVDNTSGAHDLSMNAGRVIKLAGASDTVGLSISTPDGSWLAVGNGVAADKSYGINCTGIISEAGAGIGLNGAEANSGQFAFGGNVFIQTGAGSPEGVLGAAVGSIYLRTNGGAGTTLYVKESGTGTTGWVGK